MGLFIDHVNTVLGKLRETPISSLSTDTTTEAYRAQEAVRRAVNRVWNAKQWSFKAASRTLSTTSGISEYMLPKSIGEIYSVKNSSSPYTITPIRDDNFDQYVPNPVATGSPGYLMLFNMAGAEEQPASAGTVSVVSSSTSDTTQYVLIKGLVSGQTDYELLALAGTATVTSTKSFSYIFAITKNAETAGRITVTIGSTTIATLATQDKVIRVRKMRLYPTPDATYTVTVKGFGLPPALTVAYEDTEIPPRWDYVVDQFAFALALQSKGQEQSQEFTTQMALANKFLEEDMAGEEYWSSYDIITPQRWGGTSEGFDGWTTLPNGYGLTY